MSTQLQYAVFDWKDADELFEFLEIITEDQPLCFRYVDTEDDCVVVVFGPHPISHQEAHAFYQTVVDSENTDSTEKPSDV